MFRMRCYRMTRVFNEWFFGSAWCYRGEGSGPQFPTWTELEGLFWLRSSHPCCTVCIACTRISGVASEAGSVSVSQERGATARDRMRETVPESAGESCGYSMNERPRNGRMA